MFSSVTLVSEEVGRKPKGAG